MSDNLVVIHSRIRDDRDEIIRRLAEAEVRKPAQMIRLLLDEALAARGELDGQREAVDSP